MSGSRRGLGAASGRPRGGRRASAGIAAAAIAMTIGLGACDRRPPERVALPPVPASAYEPAVQSSFATARAELDRLEAARATNARLAEAYGELAMRYHVHDVAAAAEAAYRNAAALAPRDKRWPYLLGHLYNDTARPAEARSAFEVAFAIDPDDVPLLSSFGAVALQSGDVERARSLYERLLQRKGARPLALYGLGRVAMARRDYAVAIERFEELLKLAPAASRVRAPLAAAYRFSGNPAKADEVLKGYSTAGAEPSVPDPLADALDSKVASSRGLVKRGQRFGQAGDFAAAAQAFEAAVAANPASAEAQANLGISLANLGRLDRAAQVLAGSLALDPNNAQAHLSLAVVHDRSGRDAEAVPHYRAAIERDPDDSQSRVYLADLDMRNGRAAEAAELYRQAFAKAPSSRVRFSLVLAEVAAGRYREARDELEKGLAAQPDSPVLTNAMVRILASGPDQAVRDGARALKLAEALFAKTRSPEVGQSYAMAMAEAGDFEHAVKLQQETIVAYERMGVPQARPFLERNLAVYRQGRPSREPWPADDPLFKPRSPAVARG